MIYYFDERLLDYIKAQSDPPTFRELKTHFGVGMGKIDKAVKHLRGIGALLPSDGKAGIKHAGFVAREDLQARLVSLEAENRELAETVNEMELAIANLALHNEELHMVTDNLASLLQDATGQVDLREL